MKSEFNNFQYKYEYQSIIEKWQEGLIDIDQLEKEIKTLNKKYRKEKYMLIGGRIKK